MTYEITAPPSLEATVALPSSKSISNRALIIHALTGGAVQPSNLSDCDDTAVMRAALGLMPPVIDIKAAGTAMRFLTAYLAVTPGEHVLTGTERMLHRPIGILVDALRSLGARIDYEGEEGFPPLRVRGGRLPGGRLEMQGDVSSQFISALLMVGPVMADGLVLQLTGNIVSRPYIDMTLCMMREHGAAADWTDVDTISVRPTLYATTPYLIESDWSAASYWYEMLALYGGRNRIRLGGLSDGSRQGDSVVKYIFSLLGVRTNFVCGSDGTAPGVELERRMARVRHLDFDFTNCPDLAQTVVTTCCALDIPFHFTGLASLRIKETDRIEALKTELRKLGYLIRSENSSELIWEHGRCEPTFAPIDTYEDHRMAMAFAPLAVKFPGLRIRHPEVVSKSYPRYWDDLARAGFSIRPVEAE